MLEFENLRVYGLEGAIRGMRNPMNSWGKGDSIVDENNGNFILGKNDERLAQQLILAGSEHRKFMRQIFVSVDIRAPLYWWKQFDTYKVGVTSNSCSTMHKIHDKQFTVDDFSCEQLYLGISTKTARDCFLSIIDTLNEYRRLYIETKQKKYWYALVQLLPSSYNQKRTITMSYENILTMYRQRRTHKLYEWSSDFENFIYTLPYSKKLICVFE